jgi:hypothetical protein
MLLLLAGCADQGATTPPNEHAEIAQWVEECRSADVTHLNQEASKAQRAMLPEERRLLSIDTDISNERGELERRLTSDDRLVQALNFVTFLVSMLAACFVAINANHFQVPKNPQDQAAAQPPRWFILFVILLPIVSASINGYVAIISPKDEAVQARQRLASVTAIHKTMAMSLATVNCLAADDPDLASRTRLSNNIEIAVLQFGASLRPNPNGTTPDLRNSAPPSKSP